MGIFRNLAIAGCLVGCLTGGYKITDAQISLNNDSVKYYLEKKEITDRLEEYILSKQKDDAKYMLNANNYHERRFCDEIRQRKDILSISNSELEKLTTDPKYIRGKKDFEKFDTQNKSGANTLGYSMLILFGVYFLPGQKPEDDNKDD